MPLAILLNFDDPIYAFEHQMAHRQYLAIMAPLSRFSALPYFIEPWPFPLPPLPTFADAWNLDHQQAHNDFLANLPAFWASSTIGIPRPLNQNLIDSNLNDEANRTWWTFANHQEHYTSDNAILPLPTAVTPPPAWYPGVTFPFW